MTTATRTEPASGTRVRRPRIRRRVLGLIASLLLLGALCVLSVTVGSAALSLDVVWQAFVAPDGSVSQVTVTTARVDRTVLGILVGTALGVSGALIQALTRNPLADPGILGVNAGAGFAVTLAVAFLGITRIDQYLPFAFVGAIAASALVYLAAGAGRGAGSPVRLTLVGVAFAAVLTGLSHTLALIDTETFDRMRFWGAGTLADRPSGTIDAVLLPITIGLVIAAFCLRPLNALALGEDTARAVGVRLGAARVGIILAVALLCGAATAAVGPLVFVGLVVPHAVRWITGPDWIWITLYSAVLAPALVLGADLLGRIVAIPAELQVGVMLPLIGAPVLIALVRGRKAKAL